MDSQFFSAVERSATVLTASNRLSRSLVEGYNEYQRDKGRSVWRTPRIFPLQTWLEQRWDAWMLEGPEAGPVLLKPTQEAALWESIVLESPAGRSLLRIPETAELAMKAWALLHAYRLPFESGAFTVSDDCEAFYVWAREFEQRRDANGWIEEARLADFVTSLIRSGGMARPFPIILAGFDELTPQQQDVADALCATLHAPTIDVVSAPKGVGFRDTDDEIAHAAAWARRRLEANSAARAGVVVPTIDAARSKLQRAFEEALPGAFHVSKGPALRERPIVHAALLLLELAAGEVEIERMGMILRSPYWRGADEDRSRRAWLDAVLRKEGRSPVSIASVRAHTNLWSGLEKEIRELPAEQPPSQWSKSFARLLKQVGWPGDRTLTSKESQAMEAWNKLLSDFATLDAVMVRVGLNEALSRLERLAANTEFEVEDEGAPVQVLGFLEASGLRYDHLWVLGLHDEAMPPQAQANPFLPLGMQRDRGLPHSSALRELEYNRKLLARLQASAAEVVFSYPQWEGDQPRSPSPLIEVRRASVPEPLGARWIDLIRASAMSEVVEDRVGPALPDGAEQRGGTSMLKDMAACPFRAFAKHRLGARELEDVDLGLNAREKGSGVHRVLEAIWKDLKTQENLLALNPQELQELITRSIEEALVDDGRLGVLLERRRLQRLLTQWFEIEKERPPFRVLEPEKEGKADIGGLRISTRIDRVDQLPDGRQVIIDYKTGEANGNVWSGERLDEPQVPLYCIGANARVAGAAFAQIRTGGVLLKGVSENGELGKIVPMRDLKNVAMEELIDEWDDALQQLGNAFRAGVANVDPKEKSTCQYCRLPALCRIHDSHA
jgi:probable DNA repair protein